MKDRQMAFSLNAINRRGIETVHAYVFIVVQRAQRLHASKK